MKKIIILLSLITLTILICCVPEKENSFEKKNDWEREGLKGKVKILTLNGYILEQVYGQNKKKFDYKKICKYDKKGNLVEKTEYNAARSYFLKYRNKYDSKGNEIERVWYKPDGSLYWKYKNKYDSKGNEIERIYYKPDGSLSTKYIYKYK